MTTSKKTDAEMSDLRLMRYLDGEVDEETGAEIEQTLDSDETARDKLAGLELVGELLRECVDDDERADDIADLVLAEIEDGKGFEGEAEVIELPRADPELRPAGSVGKPANDNSRTIYALAGVAAAVAAGLFMWGNMASDQEFPVASQHEPPAALEPAPSVGPSPYDSAEAEAVAGADDDEEQPGVAIAQVDFGSMSGSVFYVSSDDAAPATAVVWVTDLGDDQ